MKNNEAQALNPVQLNHFTILKLHSLYFCVESRNRGLVAMNVHSIRN